MLLILSLSPFDIRFGLAWGETLLCLGTASGRHYLYRRRLRHVTCEPYGCRTCKDRGFIIIF